jgi:hypothetical protein
LVSSATAQVFGEVLTAVCLVCVPIFDVPTVPHVKRPTFRMIPEGVSVHLGILEEHALRGWSCVTPPPVIMVGSVFPQQATVFGVIVLVDSEENCVMRR